MKKLVFITWGATWIWAASAKKFHKKGYLVAINYLTNKQAALKLVSDFPWIKSYQWDMSNESDINNVFELIYTDFWLYPTILVNNAWIVWRVKFPDLDWERFREVLEVNTIWPYLVTRQFYNSNKDNLKWKSVVFLWSLRWWPETTSASSIDYSASKAAIHNMVASMAQAMTPCRVNWIAPWFTNTPMHKWKEDRLELEWKKTVLWKYSESCEIADWVYFLASDNSSSITGQVLRVDNWGGFV